MDKPKLGIELDQVTEWIDKQFLVDCIYNYMSANELEQFIIYIEKELEGSWNLKH